MIIDRFFKPSSSRLHATETSYYCFSLYHVLYSLIDVSKRPSCSSTIILSDQIGEVVMTLYKRIEDTGLFENVILVNDLTNLSNLKLFGTDIFARIFLLVSIKRIYPFIKQLKSKRNYIFFDRPLLAQAVLELGCAVILIEDAPTSRAAFNFKATWTRNLLEFFRIIPKLGGMHENIEEIHASPQTVMNEILKKKLRPLDYDSIFKIDSYSKQMIIEIFGLTDFVSEKSFSETVILLTQPLFQDGFLLTAESQVDLYRKVLTSYPGRKVFFKIHPSDDLDYSSLVGKKIVVLSGSFPVEIFKCLNVEFSESVTLFSSSLVKAKKVTKLGVGFDRELAKRYMRYSSAGD